MFKPKKSRDALGVQIDENGLVVNSSEDKFLPLLAKILDDAANDVINTRELGKEDEQIRYVKKLRFTPGGGRFTAHEAEERRKGTEGRRPPGKSASAQEQPKARSVQISGRLLPRTLILGHAHEKLSRLIEEGQRLEIASVPHACAFLLRTLLETALTVKLKASKLYGEVAKTAKSKIFGPSLAEMLDYVNLNPQKFNLDPNAKIALEALVSRSVKQSKPQLDRIVHQPSVITHAEEMTAIREQAMPLLHELLK